MSYPRSLDEYSDEEVVKELARRYEERRKGNCDYCGQEALKPLKCISGRHKAKGRNITELLHEYGVF